MKPKQQILYLDCYTTDVLKAGRVPSSMSIGYGITANKIICQYLEASGFEVVRPLVDSQSAADGSRADRLRWILQGYEKIADAVAKYQPDLIFVFHSSGNFPAEIRRILLDLGLAVRMVGYTHGSHWDPTDLVRLERYPGLEILDLANLTALDRVLFDSEYARRTVIEGIESHNATVAQTVARKSRVVGLPMDTDLIDACRTDESFSRTTVTFNHAPVAAKNPREFIIVISRLMERYDINVMFTRAFEDGTAGASEIGALRKRFGDRVILGNNMTVRDYYRALWMSDMQVSTAFHESLGMATLEAMYTENCCLLPSRCSYPEISAGNQDVLYNSADDLQSRLAFFIEHPARMRSVGGVLARQAKQHGANVVMPRIHSVIKELLESAPTAPFTC